MWWWSENCQFVSFGAVSYKFICIEKKKIKMSNSEDIMLSLIIEWGSAVKEIRLSSGNYKLVLLGGVK